MSTAEFLLPDLGEGLTESEVVEWLVAEGESVSLNQLIVKVESAKALVEIPSPYDGVIAITHAEAGEVVHVGEPLVTFELSDDAQDDSDDVQAPEGAVSTPGGEVPTLEGDAQAPEATPAMPDSAVEDGSGPNLVGYGVKARSGRPTRRARKPATWPGSAAALADSPASQNSDRPRATPVVRALAKRRGVDLSALRGTGREGVITRHDVEKAQASSLASTSGPAPVTTGPAPARTDASGTREPVRGVRKHMAAAMTASVAIPQATVYLSVDVTESMELLERLRQHRRTRGVRLTMLALIGRAVCTLVPHHPALVTRWEDLPGGGAELVHPPHVNLSIAAATERGLVVPHIPAADTLSLVGLAQALTELVEAARAGRTPPERLSGGTISLTNVGVFGVDSGAPLLNPGESAILGIGRIARRPWEHRGELDLRHVTDLSLTFDHRVIDGEQAARFLADLGGVLEDPGLALLGGPDSAGPDLDITADQDGSA